MQSYLGNWFQPCLFTHLIHPILKLRKLSAKLSRMWQISIHQIYFCHVNIVLGSNLASEIDRLLILNITKKNCQRIR